MGGEPGGEEGGRRALGGGRWEESLRGGEWEESLRV